MKDSSKIENRNKGIVGEIWATNYLKKQKYKILETNYSNKIGEIDIIAEKKGVIVFFEVKRRLTGMYGRPSEAVDKRKQAKIKTVAEMYLMMHNKFYNDVRFDVIEMFDDKINHIENAFE